MRGALREYRIVGVHTSIPFHQWVMGEKDFVRGAYDTAFLEDHFSLVAPERGEQGQLAAIVATLLSHDQRQRRQAAATPCDDAAQEGGWRPAGSRAQRAWKLAGRREAMER
jgi:acetyl-CoA carboxylase biotin carboxylase subunit